MSKVNKTKEYAVKYLLEQKKDPLEISQELKIDLEYINNIKASMYTSNTKTDKTKDLMIRQTAAKKNNSVSIMTESASQLSDTFLQNIPPNTRKTDNHIFRPKK
jgi:hypothetical protein